MPVRRAISTRCCNRVTVPDFRSGNGTRGVAKCDRIGETRSSLAPECRRAYTRSVSLRRSSRLRSFGSSSFLRSRIDFGVTSTSSSSSI